MKSKIADPDFLGQLCGNSYKSRLEADLAKLYVQDEPQNFLFITEHKFADGKELPLFIPGLTMAWRGFIREQVKVKKNPQFVSGECKFLKNGDKEVLQLELQRGKAKPNAIRKAFKKHASLKGVELEFIEMESIEEEMEEGLQALDSVKSKKNLGNLFKTDLYDTIKNKAQAYKELNPHDAEGRKIAAEELLDLIEQWKKAHPKPSGNDAQIAEALKTLDKNLRNQLVYAAQAEDADSFYNILEEFQEVKNLNFRNLTPDDVGNALKECQDVVDAIAKWDTEHEGVNVLHVQKQRNRIAPIRQAIQDLMTRLRNQASNQEVNTSGLLSPGNFLKNAGVPLKDQGSLAKLIEKLEQIHEGTDKNGKTIEERIREARKNAGDDKSIKALQDVLEEKIEQLRALRTEAQNWLKHVNKGQKNTASNGVNKLVGSVNADINRLQKIRSEVQVKQALNSTKQGLQVNVKAATDKSLDAGKNVLKQARQKSENANKTDEELLKEAQKESVMTARINVYKGRPENANLSEEDLRKKIEVEEKDRLDKEAEYHWVNYQQAEKLSKGYNTPQEKYDDSIKGLKALIAIEKIKSPDIKDRLSFVLRGNSLQSSVLAECMEECGEDAKTNMYSNVLENLNELIDNTDEPLEVDPAKEPDEKRRRAAAARIELFYRELMRTFAGAKLKLPAPLVQYCKDMYQMSMDEGYTKEQAERFVTDVVFLRYLSPLLTRLAQRFEGKNNQSALMTLSKLLQNQANRVQPGAVKEQHLAVFKKVYEDMQKSIDLFVKSLVGTATPEDKEDSIAERAKMNENLLAFAQRNAQKRKDFLKKVSLDDFLYSNKWLPIFEAFCQQEFSPENIEAFIQARQKAYLDTPVDFLATYVFDKSNINLPGNLVKDFTAAINDYEKQLGKQPSDTGDKKWGKSVQLSDKEWETLFKSSEMIKLIQEFEYQLSMNMSDTYTRFVTELEKPDSKIAKMLWGE